MISFGSPAELMMGLFVILLAMNMGPKASPVMGGNATRRTARAACRPEDRHAGPWRWDPGGVEQPGEHRFTRPARGRARVRTQGEDVAARSSRRTAGRPEIGQGPTQTDVSNVSNTVSFEDGSAQFNAAARDAVIDMANRAKDQRFVIEVRGHVSPPSGCAAGGDRGYDWAFDRAQAGGEPDGDQRREVGEHPARGMHDNERAVPRAYTESDQRRPRGDRDHQAAGQPQDPLSRPSSGGWSSTTGRC